MFDIIISISVILFVLNYSISIFNNIFGRKSAKVRKFLFILRQAFSDTKTDFDRTLNLKSHSKS